MKKLNKENMQALSEGVKIAEKATKLADLPKISMNKPKTDSGVLSVAQDVVMNVFNQGEHSCWKMSFNNEELPVSVDTFICYDELDEGWLIKLRCYSTKEGHSFEGLLGKTVELEYRENLLRSTPWKYSGFVSKIEIPENKEGNPISVVSFELIPVLRSWEMLHTYDVIEKEGGVSLEDVVNRVCNRLGEGADIRKGNAVLTRYPVRIQFQESDFSFFIRTAQKEGFCVYLENMGKTEKIVVAEAPVFFRTEGIILSSVVSRDNPHWCLVERSQSIEPAQTKHISYYHKIYPQEDQTQGMQTFQLTSPPQYCDEAWSEHSKTGEELKFFTELEHLRKVSSASSFKITTKQLGFRVGETVSLEEGDNGATNKIAVISAVTEMENCSRVMGHNNSIDAKTVLRVTSELARYHNFNILPTPRIPGVHTGFVVGELPLHLAHTNEFGQIRVRFSWDSKKEQTCWLRVMQLWGGIGMGIQAIPRPNQEVVISYENGDPDKPVVVGSIYNTPQTLPKLFEESRSILGIVSHGDDYKNNAIFWKDNPGEQKMTVLAAKDFYINAQDTIVGVSGTSTAHTAGTSITTKSGTSTCLTAGSTMNLTAGSTMSLKSEDDMSFTTNNNMQTTVAKNFTKEILENSTTTVHKDMLETVNGNRTSEIEGDKTENIKGAFNLAVTKNIEIESDSEIQLANSGNAVIKMQKSGIIRIN